MDGLEQPNIRLLRSEIQAVIEILELPEGQRRNILALLRSTAPRHIL
jgi:hypothetical protein